MLARVIYDEYRERFSGITEEGVELPPYEKLTPEEQRSWKKVAAAADLFVKEEISRSW